MRKLSFCLALSLVLLTGCEEPVPPQIVPTTAGQSPAPQVELGEPAAPRAAQA